MCMHLVFMCAFVCAHVCVCIQCGERCVHEACACFICGHVSGWIPGPAALVLLHSLSQMKAAVLVLCG